MAKPSSSTSRREASPTEGGIEGEAPAYAAGLFGFLVRGRTAVEVGDGAWLQAMLDVEAGIARAEARAGVIPAAAGEAIAACCRAELFDPDAIGRAAAESATPIPALVGELTARVAAGETGEASRYVHFGATSQDVVDSAMMLVVRRASAALRLDLLGASEAAAGLARGYRDTPMAGRTLLQQAQPTTFGALAATWLAGLDRSGARLQDALDAGLAVQFGGAVGTLASLGDKALAVLRYLAEELDLPEPAAPWHAERTRVADVAGALGEITGAVAKAALDVTLLAQEEVGEVQEGGRRPSRGGSSTMPQKSNPVAAVAARASAARAPGLVATLLAGMPQELQRGAGTWQAEAVVLSDLFRSAGSAVAWLRESLESLEVDEARMRANLEASGGLALAERVTTALVPALGRLPAHDLVRQAAREARVSGRPFADLLAASPQVAAHLDRSAIDRLLDPAAYLGSAGIFVDRTLAACGRTAATTTRSPTRVSASEEPR